MKSLILIIGLSICTIKAFTQNEILPKAASVVTDEFVLDSFYHWGWDTMSLDWRIQDRTLYATNIDQEVTHEISFVWNDADQWTNSKQVAYTFDTHHNLTLEVIQFWNGTSWMNSDQNFYTYDANQDRVGILYQTWDGVAWVNSYQLIFTYDNDHNLLTRISQLWMGGNWLNGSRQVNTYDVDHHLTLRLFQNFTTDWNDISRSFYTYDVQGDLDTLLYQKWNFNAWTDDYRNLYDFDSHHNRIFILEQLAVGVQVWQDREKYEYTYDQFDHITHLLNSEYVNNAWTNAYQYNLINDDDQNRATEVFQTWENEWVNQDSTQYYYTGITAIPDFFDHRLMTILPNPTSDFLFVEYAEPINGSIAVYSAQGTKLLEFKAQQEQSFLIKVASFPPGIYFVALQVGHQVLTKGFEKI